MQEKISPEQGLSGGGGGAAGRKKTRRGSQTTMSVVPGPGSDRRLSAPGATGPGREAPPGLRCASTGTMAGVVPQALPAKPADAAEAERAARRRSSIGRSLGNFVRACEGAVARLTGSPKAPASGGIAPAPGASPSFERLAAPGKKL